MENWREFVWQLIIGVLVVFFGGWALGGVLNLAATANPQMVSAIFCPAGSSALWTSDQANPTISCLDQSGASVPALTEAESVALQRIYFYRPSYFVMAILVIGWFIWSYSRKRMRRQASLWKESRAERL